MFSNKETKKNPIAAAPSTSGHNSLVAGTVVEGEVQSQGDIRIDGFIRGVLHCKSKVVIGPSGVIEGTITCQNAVIEGCLDGQINVEETLKLEKTAKVTAEIVTSKFIIAPGAVFNGTCKMGSQDIGKNSISKKQSTKSIEPKSIGGASLKKEAI